MDHSLNKEYNNPEQYKGSLKGCLLFAVFWGLVLYLLNYFIELLLPIELYWGIYSMLHFMPFSPWSGILFCMIICMGIALLLRGRVRIYDEDIRVYGWGKVTRIPLKAFHHIEVKKIKISIGFIPINIWKSRLYYSEGNRLRRCRLHGFDDRITDKLNNRIRINATEQMNIDTKKEMTDSVDNGLSGERLASGTEFTLDHDLLFSKEASLLRRALLIYILFAAACILVILLDHTFYDVGTLMLVVVAADFFIACLVRIMIFRRRKAMCPVHIRVNSFGIFIDKKRFSYKGIDKIILSTGGETPIFPAQRFIIIEADGKEKYWLGSDGSYPEYSSFCSTLQKAMVFFPDKLEYKNSLFRI